MTYAGKVIPGAIILINEEISDVIKTHIIKQLQIEETITGTEFDARLLIDPDYVKNVRALRSRVMVLKDFRDTTNRTVFDVVLYVRHGIASIERNCFGPPSQSFPVHNLHWGQICIHDTDLTHSCSNGSC